ncbi:hypothetical protein V6N13_009991 [Hibiscus sabdariffa]
MVLIPAFLVRWFGLLTNRNNPVEIQAVLELTSQGNLILKDANGTLLWSVSKSISGLNLSAEGNLVLFNKTNHMVWQSFDNPTDTLVVGQRLLSGKKLRGSISPEDPSEGLYAFALIGGKLAAYVNSDPSQIYYASYSLEPNNNSVLLQTGRFGSFSVADSARFIQLGSDGCLKAYEWKDSKWEWTDLLNLGPCEYPLRCGKYSVCLEEGCSCLDYASENQTNYFRPLSYSNPDLGCYAISPISCDLPLHHSFLQLQGYYSQAIHSLLFSETTTIQDCQEACLNNCSCKAAIYTRGHCTFLSQVFSIKRSDDGDGNISAFIKVQNSVISSLNFPRRKKQNTRVIVGSILGAIFFVFLICIFIFLRLRKGFQEVEEDYLDNELGTPTRFSYEDLRNITNNFSNKLGEGGFGSVFHGILPSASEVAVKNLVGFGPVNKSFIAEEEDWHLLGLFRRKQEEGKLMDLVDQYSDDMQSNAAEVAEMMKVATWCLQAEYARRPSMSTVVKLLEGST